MSRGFRTDAPHQSLGRDRTVSDYSICQRIDLRQTPHQGCDRPIRISAGFSASGGVRHTRLHRAGASGPAASARRQSQSRRSDCQKICLSRTDGHAVTTVAIQPQSRNPRTQLGVSIGKAVLVQRLRSVQDFGRKRITTSDVCPPVTEKGSPGSTLTADNRLNQSPTPSRRPTVRLHQPHLLSKKSNRILFLW